MWRLHQWVFFCLDGLVFCLEVGFFMCVCQHYVSSELESKWLLLFLLLEFLFLVPQREDSVVTFRKTLGQQKTENKVGSAGNN